MALALLCAKRHPKTCGADRDRTDDIQLAKLALSQLSYSPKPVERLNLKVDLALDPTARRLQVCLLLNGPQMVLGGVEPPTSRLSGARSSQLSYRPVSTRLRTTPPIKLARREKKRRPAATNPHSYPKCQRPMKRKVCV